MKRGAARGLIANLPPAAREQVLSTEYYIRHNPCSTAAPQTELTT
ncbi:hypothetical protein ABT010_39765 [Streptomyces sp. NPDC002668]